MACSLTIRFSNFTSFEEAARVVASSKKPLTAEDCMTVLVESIVDRLADILENLGRTIDTISHDIFQVGPHSQGRKGNELKKMLKRIGRCGDVASAIRDSLAGLDRICNFITENGKRPLAPVLQGQWGIINRDITSLTDFVSQKNVKVQFLLDAILGFVSIEQNTSVNILTAVSLSGIIPTLIAGIYGMNFKNMPELQWAYGYYYCLGLIVASILLPLWWFWYKGWFGNKL
ncbi:CorA family divalent cation transporter [Entomobacter blattae]|uniref:Magnesium transport protein CorA n=1 Tax=Entomobacter blattae TaxID=2762277 RepID=A0A7H1NPN8_9PROT|nr:CorA family divalent cation transporter [Entomobacter blattae]QNT77748.1 Magnesium transport protein CorA [Entomobacter blattae]